MLFYFSTPSTKSRVILANRPDVLTLVGALGGTKGAAFLQSATDKAEFVERTFAYHYRLSLLLRGFNKNELDQLFESHPFFNGRLDQDGKADVSEAFDSAYHTVQSALIDRLTAEAERWLKTLAGSAYYEAYHLAKHVF